MPFTLDIPDWVLYAIGFMFFWLILVLVKRHQRLDAGKRPYSDSDTKPNLLLIAVLIAIASIIAIAYFVMDKGYEEFSKALYASIAFCITGIISSYIGCSRYPNKLRENSTEISDEPEMWGLFYLGHLLLIVWYIVFSRKMKKLQAK